MSVWGAWGARGGAALCCRFFFSSRRRHTRFKCDWSSDVCSSDLLELEAQARRCGTRRRIQAVALPLVAAVAPLVAGAQIGRASCRGRVEISVVAGSLKKKKKNKSRAHATQATNENSRRRQPVSVI